MPSQRFDADIPTTFKNGAIGYAPRSRDTPLGPFAKVRNCPVKGITKRYTCYATNYPDTFFSVPACVEIKRKHVKGFFTMEEDGPMFNPDNSHKHLVVE